MGSYLGDVGVAKATVLSVAVAYRLSACAPCQEGCRYKNTLEEHGGRRDERMGISEESQKFPSGREERNEKR